MLRMRPAFPLSVTALALFSAACQDLIQPPAVADGPLVSASTASAGQEAERVVAGQILARLVEGADDQAVATNYGLQVNRPAARGGFTVFQGAAGNERTLAARMGADAQVVWAEPNYLRQTTTIDSKLWAFYNPGGLTITFTRGRNDGDVVGSKISVNDADEDNVEGYGAGGVAVKIASIDGGVDFDHQEFHQEFRADLLIAGWDFYSNDDDPSGGDHGTHTTGTMVGRTVGVAGVSGAGTNVKVVVYRVCGRFGCPISAVVAAIYAAADVPGMVAMNLSLGGPSDSDAEAAAIAYAVDTMGVLVIASAGNAGESTVHCPACNPLAISVAASNWQDELSYYSNWGEGLDITAPGGELYSNTTAEGGIWSSVVGGYAYFQGTSMAAPQVTGTAGVVASMNPTLRGGLLRARILGKVDDLGDPGYDTKFGHGRLNSYRAVKGVDLVEASPQNRDPVANDDAASTTEGSAVSINVLANDTDADNDPLTVTGASDGTYGTTKVKDDNTVTYTHGGGSTETDFFTYDISDGKGGTDRATVTVTVNAAGQGPSVASCTPDFGDPNQKLTVTINGSNFVSGADADFGSRIAVQSVSFFSDTRLDVQIKIHRRAASGGRDVTVTNLDGESGSLTGCFTVN